MDPTKKRKLDENGTVEMDPTLGHLTPQDIRKIIEPFSHEQILDILQTAAASHPDVLDAVRSLADREIAQRKLFVRGLGWETTSDSLRSLFAAFGELEEAVVILDKNTGKSKGYGFVTYKHIDGAILALKEPSKKIDGRVAVAQLASAGLSGGPNTNSGPGVDVSLRKIYVGNVPYDMPAERLLSHFAAYGEIEEGPLGFDKQTGKSKGFALFVYKTAEAAQASLVEPLKIIDGRQLTCKLASEGKKGKQGGGPGHGQGQGLGADGMGMQSGGPMSGPYGGGVSGQGGYPGYGGYPSGPGMGQHQNSMNSSYSSIGGQGPGGGYGSGGGGVGGYAGSHYGGPNSAGYGGGMGGSHGGVGVGMGGAGGGIAGGPGSLGGAGRGSSMYGMQPGGGGSGLPSGGYNEGGHYGSSAYPGGPQHQPTGTSPAPRVGPGGIYQNPPPYY